MQSVDTSQAADRPEVFAVVKKLLDRFNPDQREITADLKLSEDLNLDSVAAMDLVMEVEDEFEIDIPINLVSEVETVGDLVKVVEGRLAES